MEKYLVSASSEKKILYQLIVPSHIIESEGRPVLTKIVNLWFEQIGVKGTFYEYRDYRGNLRQAIKDGAYKMYAECTYTSSYTKVNVFTYGYEYNIKKA